MVLTKAYCVCEGWVELIAPPSPPLSSPLETKHGIWLRVTNRRFIVSGGEGPPFLPDGKGLEANLEGSSLGGGGEVIKSIVHRDLPVFKFVDIDISSM